MHELSKFFDAAYLINLPERVDRLRSARTELTRAGFELGGSAVQLFAASKFPERGTFPNVGARGCFHSHLTCLRQSYLDGSQRVLMIEDDISFNDVLPRLSAFLRRELERLDWDFFYLGHEGTGQIPNARASISARDFVFQPWSRDILTTHCYAVSGRVLERLVRHLDQITSGPEGDQEKGPMPIDGAFNIFRR